MTDFVCERKREREKDGSQTYNQRHYSPGKLELSAPCREAPRGRLFPLVVSVFRVCFFI